jgi:hypothetical protein
MACQGDGSNFNSRYVDPSHRELCGASSSDMSRLDGPWQVQGALMSLGTKAGSYGRAVSQAEQLEATRLRATCVYEVLIRAKTGRYSRRGERHGMACCPFSKINRHRRASNGQGIVK